MSKFGEEQYLDTLNHILNFGFKKPDRTGIGTISENGIKMKFDLDNVFPLITTKKMFWKGIVHELLWFLSGNTNIKYLLDNNVHIWDEWQDENGDVGPIYGYQWRNFGGSNIDQISEAINMIKNNPDSRRIIISAWNPIDFKKLKPMQLPPCHILSQFIVNDDKLTCILYQRSCDMFLGVPFNIASYSLLTYMIAHVCNLKPYEFIHILGDAHIYLNHIEQVKKQLERNILEQPTISLNENIKNIFDFKYEDIKLNNYKCHDIIKADIAV